MPISTARFVLARGRSASGILAIAKLTPSAIRSDCEAGFSGGGVVFFDRPMLLEVALEAAAASAAASPVWVAVDFDRACRVRRRGVRWRPRAGWFASPLSDFSALFACLRGCLLAIVFILWIRIALAMLAPPQARRSEPGGWRPRRRPTTWTAMLPVPGKSSGKCGGTT